MCYGVIIEYLFYRKQYAFIIIVRAIKDITFYHVPHIILTHVDGHTQ